MRHHVLCTHGMFGRRGGRGDRGGGGGEGGEIEEGEGREGERGAGIIYACMANSLQVDMSLQ